MKKKNPEQEIEALAADIERQQRRWKHINTNGSQDPFWADGCNMNLVRNHISYDKERIAEICAEKGLPLPPEYFTPLPPEVDPDYMASFKQKKRVRHLRQLGEKLTMKKVAYDDRQTSM